MKTLFALACLIAAPAYGQAIEPDRVALAVAHADLDLATAAGKSRLDLRIGRAAAEACGDASATDLAGQNDVRRCRVAATTRAAAQRAGAIARRSAPVEVASGQ